MRFSSRDEEPEDGEVVEDDAVWKNPLATTKYLKSAPSASSSQKASSYKKSRPSFIPSIDAADDDGHRPRRPPPPSLSSPYQQSRRRSSSHSRKPTSYEDEERGSGMQYFLPKILIQQRRENQSSEEKINMQRNHGLLIAVKDTTLRERGRTGLSSPA